MISHTVRIWKAWHWRRFTTRRKIATGIERLPAPESINRWSKLASLIVDRPSQKDISYLLPYVDGACVGWGGACVVGVGQWHPHVSLGSHGQADIRFRQIWFVTLPPLAPSAGAVRHWTWATMSTAGCDKTHCEATLLTHLDRERGFVQLLQHICCPDIPFFLLLHLLHPLLLSSSKRPF